VTAAADCNRGAELCDAGQFAEAEASLRAALDADPDLAEARYNLGIALTEQNRLEEAEGCYRDVLRLRPRDARAHANLGLVLLFRGDLGGAVSATRRAIELRPDLVEARQNFAWLRLLTGGFAPGWERRSYMNRRTAPPHGFAQPAWKGEPLHGRTIALHCEQGLGDFLQFVRFAPLVAARGGRVLVLCEPRMHALLARSGFELANDATPFDLHAAVTDLPLLLEVAPSQLAATMPYLAADAERTKQWRRELRGVVGIAWRGNPSHPFDTTRSVPLRCFAPVSECAPLVSLQLGAEEPHDFPLMRLGDAIADLDETAAIIASLDLVVTCDTSIAHLAGALGRPVFVALPAAADWRWLARRDDTPWYPTMRLFRQEVAGEWEPVFVCIAEAVRRRG